MSRALTERQARACETAAEPRCRCRCAGVCHGAGRDLERLPAEDPHAWREGAITLDELLGEPLRPSQTTPDIT